MGLCGLRCSCSIVFYTQIKTIQQALLKAFNCFPDAKTSILLQKTAWSDLSPHCLLPNTSFCLGYFSITVLKHHNQGNSLKRSIWLWFQRVTSPWWQSKGAESSHLDPQLWGGKSTLGMAVVFWNFLQHLLILLKQFYQLGTSYFERPKFLPFYNRI